MLDRESIKSHWSDIKGAVLRQWDQISDADLEKTNGDVNSISNLVQQKYGLNRDEVTRKMDVLFRPFGESEMNVSGDIQAEDAADVDIDMDDDQLERDKFNEDLQRH